MGYSLDPGPRAWRPGTDRPAAPGTGTGTGEPGTAGDAGMPDPDPDPGPARRPVSPPGAVTVSPATAPLAHSRARRVTACRRGARWWRVPDRHRAVRRPRPGGRQPAPPPLPDRRRS